VFQNAPFGAAVLDAADPAHATLLDSNACLMEMTQGRAAPGVAFADLFDASEGPVDLAQRLRRTLDAPMELQLATNPPVAAHVHFARAEDGRGLAYVVNVSEQRELEQRLAQSEKMREIGELAAGVAHDFNNLLTVIVGFGSCVLDALPEDGGTHADMQELMAAVERARTLAGRLLRFSRQSKQQEIALVDVGALVAELERMLRHLLGGTVKYSVQLQSGLWPVRIDKGGLEQVILNLALNARDAMPHGGSLSVEVVNSRPGDRRGRMDVAPDVCDVGARDDVSSDHAGSDYVVLIVSDTGHGMEPDTQRRIFEPFFTTKALGRGTGLGLSMASSIVAEAGGFIRVHSEQGRGATFAVHLPRAQHCNDSVCTSTLQAKPAR